MDLKEIAFQDHASLQQLLKFKALANSVMVPGPYSEAHSEFKQYITTKYNEIVKKIEENEWYKAEKEEMIKMAQDMASDNEDIDPDFEPNMNDILKRA